jgi:hypothetical protein
LVSHVDDLSHRQPPPGNEEWEEQEEEEEKERRRPARLDSSFSRNGPAFLWDRTILSLYRLN